MNLLYASPAILVALSAISACRAADSPQTAPASNPASQAAAWGKPAGGLQSQITADSAEFAPKDPVLIHYIIKNASDQNQKVAHNGFWPSNRITVTGPDGKPATLTKAGEIHAKEFGGPVEKSSVVTLEPGRTDENFPVLNLRDFFILETPGEYTVQYNYLQKPDPVVSNLLTITLLQKKP